MGGRERGGYQSSHLPSTPGRKKKKLHYSSRLGQTDCRELSCLQGYLFLSTYASLHPTTNFLLSFFRRSRSVCENRKNLYPSKISRYMIIGSGIHSSDPNITPF